MKTTDHSTASNDLQGQNDMQKILIDNLKIKLLTTVRGGEFDAGKLREEISVLKGKCENVDEVQSTLEQYKDLYNQALFQLQKMNNAEKEKRRVTKIIEDKNMFIKKLQSRFESKEQQLEEQKQK